MRISDWSSDVCSSDLHSGARCFGVPQIALQIQDRRRPDQIMVEVVRVQVLGSAEKGVHRALRVGRDTDEAAGGRRLLRPRRRIALDAKRAYVVSEHFAQMTKIGRAWRRERVVQSG